MMGVETASKNPGRSVALPPLFGPASPKAGVLLSGLLLTLCGCGSDVPYSFQPIEGKVTYDDGTPIPGGRVVVTFLPQTAPVSPKTVPRAGVAELAADGSFKFATTWKHADGVIPGPQKVLVQSLNAQLNSTGAVDSRYASPATTPLSTEVGPGKHVIELTIPKPIAKPSARSNVKSAH